MRLRIILSALLATALLAAGGRLPTLTYRGGGQGKVVFDHQLHASQGFRCNDCHTNFAGSGKPLFFTRKQGLITFGDHTSGAKCFACHNAGGAQLARQGAADHGQRAPGNCDSCHRKTGGS